MHPFPCFFALLLLLLFADAHRENLIEQVIPPVDQPFDDNYTLTGSLDDDRTIETEIIAAKHTYLMKLNVTTSGDAGYIETYAIPDTGSDLIWLNVKGCCGDACHCCSCETKCIEKPKQLFNCKDPICDDLAKSLKIEKKCSSEQEGISFCMYDINKYADGFTTQGWFGKGKFSFPIIDKADNINSKDINFGVSNMSKGGLAAKSQGIVGLGGGEFSLIKQLEKKDNKMDHKFSYCLPNPNSTKTRSKIRFGNKVDTTSDKFTPLLDDQSGCKKDRYCVHLATISVGKRRKKITVGEKTTNVMVIDSGSTFTRLVDGLFQEFLKKVRQVIGEEHKPKPVKHYDNCFEESVVSAEELKTVSFGFGDRGKTKIELKWKNFFDNYTSDEGNKYRCLTVVDGKKNDHHTLGNRAQMDFLVAFDLKENKVYFDAKDSCGEEKNLELSVLSE